MKDRTIVLVDPELDRDPLYLDFEESIPVGNRDEIVCEISISQAQKMLERKNLGGSFEDHIDVCREVVDYLEDLKEEERIWEQVVKTEEVVQKMIQEERTRKREGNKI